MLFYYHPIFLKHDPGRGHPERKERLLSILEGIKRSGLNERLEFVENDKASEKLLTLVHTKDYVERVLRTRGKSHIFDADTLTSPESVDSALYAVGAVIEAVEAVLRDQNSTAFCAVRPPGHHAESDRAMGFCLFNNVAIGAEFAVREKGLKRVLIFDPDLHHGNGTQKTFYYRSDVFYISIHRYPYYPGTGHYSEMGEGEGLGYNLNFPLPGGMGDDEYIYIARNVVCRVIEAFKPQLVIFSAGFDAHIDDPLGDMRVTSKGFKEMYGEIIGALRKSLIPFFFVLEGGYSLEGLSESTSNLLSSLLNEDFYHQRELSPDRIVIDLVEVLMKKLENYL